MAFISTNSTSGTSPEVPLKEALFRGLAPDGGLYMPRAVPRLPEETLRSFPELAWTEVASVLARHLLSDELDAKTITSITQSALDFPLPLVRLTDRIHLLELFRGPTLAFKDVGARFMARLMAHFRGRNTESLTILTATSGDTGGAVAHAFLGLPGIRVVVLFPDGKVTPRQELQFSTLGENVTAVAVQGDFDDCQRMAKGAFGNPELRTEVALTSANSINIGRLLPQSFYYFEAWARFQDWGSMEGSKENPSILISVPSGNFGNLAAGLMAKRMGLPGVRFLAATNANDGVPEFLKSGHFLPRPSRRTLSTAMDVGDPSNLARILHLYDSDLNRLRRDLSGRSVSDEETRGCIRRVYDATGYILDPHSAVGFQALERELEDRPKEKGIVFATAHPAKFAEVVEPALGEKIPLPPELASCLGKERVVTPMPPETQALERFLRGG